MICHFFTGNNVEQPSNFSTQTGDSSLTYSWEHQNHATVDHYQIDLQQGQGRNQTILVTGKSVTIDCIPGVSYSATVRAVTVCPGIMSAPTSTPGVYFRRQMENVESGNGNGKWEMVVMLILYSILIEMWKWST